MPTQNVHLPDHLAEFIRKTVDTGRYNNASEVVRAGLRLLEQREEEDRLKLERLRAEVQRGLDDLERGHYVELDSPEDIAGFMDDVGQRGRQRLRREAGDGEAAATQ